MEHVDCEMFPNLPLWQVTTEKEGLVVAKRCCQSERLELLSLSLYSGESYGVVLHNDYKLL